MRYSPQGWMTSCENPIGLGKSSIAWPNTLAPGLHMGRRRREPPTSSLQCFVQTTLAALPEALRAELESAVTSLDVKRFALLISQVSEHNAALGKALARLAARFTYTPILLALESSRSRSTR
jgi:hypothetical protein